MKGMEVDYTLACLKIKGTHKRKQKYWYIYEKY